MIKLQKFKSYLREIIWERIFLNLKVEVHHNFAGENNLHFYLLNNDAFPETEFDVIKKEKQIYYLKLNITNSGVNRCIDNGEYKVLVTDEFSTYSFVEFEGSEDYLAEHCLCLRYLNNVGAYTVTFNMSEGSDEPILSILFYNANKKAMAYMKNSLAKSNSKTLLQKIKSKLFEKNRKRRYIKNIYSIGKKLFHSKKENILFLSEQDDKLAHNMRCIYQKILARQIDEQYNIFFSLRKKTSENVSILSSIKMLLSIIKADIIIVDDHVPAFDWLMLKNTKLIQVWHAGAGFKGVGYSRWGHKGAPGPFSCHRQYTYCLAGSQEIAHFFSEQFGILDEQIIPTGMPRMDEYLDNNHKFNIINNLIQQYPVLKDKKVILFAPTYRGENRRNAYYPYEKIDFDKLYDYCVSDNAVVLFKMHPWVSSELPVEEKYKDRFFDFNNYSDINELFYITDILITDYSSSMYEYALMNKPMLAYAFDKTQYSLTRGFHRSYDDNVPGKVCETFNELLNSLESRDFQYDKHEIYMKNHFDYVDTSNSNRVIDWLILGNLPEMYQNKLNRKVEYIDRIRNKNFSYIFEGSQEE